MSRSSFLLYLVFIFPLSELILLILKRTKKSDSREEDRGSLQLLWFMIILSVAGAIVLQRYSLPLLPLSQEGREWSAIVLLCAGYIVRWGSVLSLGRLFTVDVAIQHDHRLLQQGFYKYIRHPSYTGLLSEFLGLAVFFGTWISLGVVMFPIAAAVLNRVHYEEKALSETFGEEYAAYASRTKRFLPGIL